MQRACITVSGIVRRICQVGLINLHALYMRGSSPRFTTPAERPHQSLLSSWPIFGCLYSLASLSHRLDDEQAQPDPRAETI